jgi:hypothetical protein
MATAVIATALVLVAAVLCVGTLLVLGAIANLGKALLDVGQAVRFVALSSHRLAQATEQNVLLGREQLEISRVIAVHTESAAQSGLRH